jgi:hypothetical protein
MPALTFLSFVVAVSANVAVIFNFIPAFRRTKNRAFVLIGFAALLGEFDTVCDHTIAIDMRGNPAYATYRIARRFTFMAGCVLGTAGVILLARAAGTFPKTNPSLPENRDA